MKYTISSMYNAAIGTMAMRKNGETMALTMMADRHPKVKRKKVDTVPPSL